MIFKNSTYRKISAKQKKLEIIGRKIETYIDDKDLQNAKYLYNKYSTKSIWCYVDKSYLRQLGVS
jgi:hypothetical protein